MNWLSWRAMCIFRCSMQCHNFYQEGYSSWHFGCVVSLITGGIWDFSILSCLWQCKYILFLDLICISHTIFLICYSHLDFPLLLCECFFKLLPSFLFGYQSFPYWLILFYMFNIFVVYICVWCVWVCVYAVCVYVENNFPIYDLYFRLVYNAFLINKS